MTVQEKNEHMEIIDLFIQKQKKRIEKLKQKCQEKKSCDKKK
jgi:hypothetical protein